jgi:hypothetical protein
MLNLFNKNIKSQSTDADSPKSGLTNKSPKSFYTSYFDTYELIKSDHNLFTPKRSDPSMEASYFGAFVNKTLNTATQNAIIKLGIPRLLHQTEETKKQIKLFQDDFNKFIDRYEITDTSQKETHVDSANNKEKETKLYKDLFCDSEVLNNPGDGGRGTLGVILKNQPEKYIYYSNLLEENVTLNPYKVINYEIDLQKCYSNIVYRLSEPKHISEIYTYLIYLLQGIPSKLFTFNTEKLKFELADRNFRLLTCNETITQNFLAYFMDFGTKMYMIQLIIETYLYRHNENTPYVVKQFYVDVNTIVIKINEGLIKIKSDLENGDLQSIGLYNKVEEYNSIITLTFKIFNLPSSMEKYNTLPESRDLNTFILLYDDYNIKSHKLLNALFDLYNTFHIKSNDYYLVKSLLLNSLKSYLYYILKGTFNNEIYDQHKEYFLIKSGGNIVLEGSRVPKFLKDMGRVLLNLSILVNYIHSLDYNYFGVCNLKVNELILYISDINFSEELNSSVLTELMNSKNSIFNKKLELMYNVNEGYMVNVIII